MEDSASEQNDKDMTQIGSHDIWTPSMDPNNAAQTDERLINNSRRLPSKRQVGDCRQMLQYNNSRSPVVISQQQQHMKLPLSYNVTGSNNIPNEFNGGASIPFQRTPNSYEDTNSYLPRHESCRYQPAQYMSDSENISKERRFSWTLQHVDQKTPSTLTHSSTPVQNSRRNSGRTESDHTAGIRSSPTIGPGLEMEEQSHRQLTIEELENALVGGNIIDDSVDYTRPLVGLRENTATLTVKSDPSSHLQNGVGVTPIRNIDAMTRSNLNEQIGSNVLNRTYHLELPSEVRSNKSYINHAYNQNRQPNCRSHVMENSSNSDSVQNKPYQFLPNGFGSNPTIQIPSSELLVDSCQPTSLDMSASTAENGIEPSSSEITRISEYPAGDTAMNSLDMKNVRGNFEFGNLMDSLRQTYNCVTTTDDTPASTGLKGDSDPPTSTLEQQDWSTNLRQNIDDESKNFRQRLLCQIVQQDQRIRELESELFVTRAKTSRELSEMQRKYLTQKEQDRKALEDLQFKCGGAERDKDQVLIDLESSRRLCGCAYDRIRQLSSRIELIDKKWQSAYSEATQLREQNSQLQIAFESLQEQLGNYRSERLEESLKLSHKNCFCQDLVTEVGDGVSKSRLLQIVKRAVNVDLVESECQTEGSMHADHFTQVCPSDLTSDIPCESQPVPKPVVKAPTKRQLRDAGRIASARVSEVMAMERAASNVDLDGILAKSRPKAREEDLTDHDAANRILNGFKRKTFAYNTGAEVTNKGPKKRGRSSEVEPTTTRKKRERRRNIVTKADDAMIDALSVELLDGVS